MKAKIITIAVLAASLALVVVGIKLLPLWSTAITITASALSFVGGWFSKKWYDSHVKGGAR